ncbi:hypothetical protein NDU88_006732 [Pleurodeles waltl]|uniref:Uncharacterized protein n=1 Tax=Pleurodeles waltl TaxID=8319 RepID=A0AAV7QJM7_PLEWA|nr:hypothetical protein NDU88_006732 [Pleurodeles waltl]
MHHRSLTVSEAYFNIGDERELPSGAAILCVCAFFTSSSAEDGGRSASVHRRSCCRSDDWIVRLFNLSATRKDPCL